ncbi:MAG TPA: hypothetical protein DHN33_00600 [Eubacteriaceae bacterium]|nr:hypothetical protein [Eubacteriaceae bacterium]
MKHEKYREQISRYIDGDLTESEQAELEEHLQTCETCKEELQELQEMVQDLNAIQEIPLDFDLKGKVLSSMKSKDEKNKLGKKNNWKKYAGIAAGFVIVLLLAAPLIRQVQLPFGMGSSGDEAVTDNMQSEPSWGGTEEDGAAMDQGEAFDDDMGLTQEQQAQDEETEGSTTKNEVFDPEQIIYNGSIDLYTDRFDDTLEQLREYVDEIDGFVERSDSNLNESSQAAGSKYAFYTIRVPADRFEKAMKDLQEFGEVENTSISSSNITAQYRDVKSELDSFKVQEERLLEYLEEAESMEDLLLIEEQLARVRNEIHYRQTIIDGWDQQIDYSTIRVQVYEKEVSTSSIQSPFGNFFERMGNTLIESLNVMARGIASLILLLVALIPYMIVFGVLGWGGYKVVQKFRGRNE